MESESSRNPLKEAEMRGSSAVARDDSSILVISWQSIERVARFYPRISSLFFKNLSSILGGSLMEQFQTNVGKDARTIKSL